MLLHALIKLYHMLLFILLLRVGITKLFCVLGLFFFSPYVSLYALYYEVSNSKVKKSDGKKRRTERANRQYLHT